MFSIERLPLGVAFLWTLGPSAQSEMLFYASGDKPHQLSTGRPLLELFS